MTTALLSRFSHALTHRLRNTSGAIDLFSIMVGVIVLSVIAAGISATVFGVIPWAQDETAKRDVNAVQVAQGVARVKDGAFRTIEELVDAGYIKNPNSADPEAAQKTFVALGQDSRCYVVGTRSQTGKVFYATSATSTVHQYVDGQTNGSECADISAKAAGTPPAATGIMRSTWDTRIGGCSTITLPLHDVAGWGPFAGTISWGDGSTTPIAEDATHTYSDTPGVKTVTVNGTFPGYGRVDYAQHPCITAVSAWANTGTTHLNGAFAGTSSLTRIASFPAPVSSMYRAFAGSAVTSLPENLDVSGVQDMTEAFANSRITSLPDSFNTQSLRQGPGMFNSSAITSLPAGFDTSNMTSMWAMFSGSAITSLPAGFDTSNVTDMSYMFQSSAITSLPAGFDTSNVTNMSGMFDHSKAITLPENLDLSNVTDMTGMFFASEITSLPADFDTSNVTNMSRMFSSAAFTSLPADFNTSNVVHMAGMFDGNVHTTSLPAGFNTSNVINMSNMFYSSVITELPVGFDTSNVTNMSYMFYSTYFTDLPSSFNTSQVLDMTNMFTYAVVFDGDLSGWDVGSAYYYTPFSDNSPLTAEHMPIWVN